MPITQTNVYVCEVCGITIEETKKVDAYSDPVVGLPKGWDYIHDQLACEECLKKRS